MNVDTAANCLLREMPYLSVDEAKQYVGDLRDMMKNYGDVFGGTDVFVNKILTAAPKALQPGLAIPGNEQTLRRHVLTMVDEIIPAADRFTWDWNAFGWPQMRDSVANEREKIQEAAEKAEKAREAAELAAQQAQNAGGGQEVKKKYVWANKRPRGFPDEVHELFIEHAEKIGLVGKVVVAGDEFEIKPYEGPDPLKPEKSKDSEKPELKSSEHTIGGSVSQAATMLGLRKQDMFSDGYVRAGEKLITEVFTHYENVEAFVNAHFAVFKNSEQAGRKIKFGQLMTSARTLDLVIKAYATMGKTRKELWNDDVLELHASNIAREDYILKTSNYEGAEAISGIGDFLLPADAITKAATYTNNLAKLRNNLRNTAGRTGTDSKGAGKGGAGFVPIADRTCYECGQIGHLGKDCPKRKERLAREGKAAGKGAKKEVDM